MSTTKINNNNQSFLFGIKIIELVGLAPVPFCGLLLADFGASVILVINKSGKLANFDQRLCRGKEKILLDFKSSNDLKELKKLCLSSDVLLDPYRPGILEKLGLEPFDLLEKNPKLIIARLTGYGQTGPMANKAGHDINYVGLSGLLPTIVGKKNCSCLLWPPANLLADFAGGGLLVAYGIISAIFRREKIGKGCILDCSMTEGIAYLGTFINLYRSEGWMWDEEYSVFSGKCPVYRTYKTADGKWMAVGALEDKFQKELFETLCVEDFIFDLDKLTKEMEKIFASKTQKEWIKIFQDKDACVTPVLDMTDNNLQLFPQHYVRNSFQFDKENNCWVPRPAPKIMEIGNKELNKLKSKI
uniref:Uncharacterized protein n=1 Tax=Meloidogyne hapla TaxID=6305 RepID=A0A1I8C095_MELHA